MYSIYNGKPVYLTREKEFEIRENITTELGWDPIAFGVAIQNRKIWGNLYDAIRVRFNEEVQQNPESYLEFDFIGQSAEENIGRILEDYCDYYGHAILEECQTLSPQVDSHDASWSYGKALRIVHISKPDWWQRYKYKMKDREVVIVIYRDQVSRIKGSIENFWIQCAGVMVECYEKKLYAYPMRQ